MYNDKAEAVRFRYSSATLPSHSSSAKRNEQTSHGFLQFCEYRVRFLFPVWTVPLNKWGLYLNGHGYVSGTCSTLTWLHRWRVLLRPCVDTEGKDSKYILLPQVQSVFRTVWRNRSKSLAHWIIWVRVRITFKKKFMPSKNLNTFYNTDMEIISWSNFKKKNIIIRR